MRALAALLIAVVFVSGCAKRDRSNPFDPSNPDTGGRPADFVAIAGDGLVSLRWRPATAPDLLGFRVFRRTEAEVTYTDISGVLPVTTGFFTDGGLSNGTTHFYRIFFVFTRGQGAIPSEDVATPGALRPWVAEFQGGTVARLTPDARRISFRNVGYSSPSDVAVDPSTGILWISDTFGGLVQVLNPGTGQFTNIVGLSQPGAIALDNTDETGWVCDPGSDRVLHYSRFGGSPITTIGLIDTPLDAAVDPINRTLWVCERGGNRVRAFSSTGSPLWALPIPAPSRVAVDSVTKNGWVTSFETGKLYVISPGGALLDSAVTMAGPIGVTVDSRRGRIWVADAFGNTLVAFARDATESFRVGSLSQVREVAVDLRTGDAWAVVPGTGSVVRVSETGVVRQAVAGLIDPVNITIDPGP